MEKLSVLVAELTRQEWRDFGTYYRSDDDAKEWHLYGSASGFVRLAETLERFAATRIKQTISSEHEHLGPHFYLTLTDWPTPRIDGRGIWGEPHDFEQLADIFRVLSCSSSPGQTHRVQEQFAPSAQYALVLHVEPESFDPSSLDPQLTG